MNIFRSFLILVLGFIPALVFALPRVENSIWVCSFNIQFLGFTIDRDNEGLAELLRDEKCDIVVVQELIAPPSEKYLARSALNNFPVFPAEAYEYLNLKSKKNLSPLGTLRVFPPGPDFTSLQDAIDALILNPGLVRFDPIIPEPKSTRFFEAMEAAGFRNFILSDEDTGPTQNRRNTTASEWWLTFFNPQKVAPAEDLPSGFLSPQRVAAADYERVPFAFSFRTKDKSLDFVLISVHREPDRSRFLRRQHELRSIAKWVEQSNKEKDFFILGDTNLQNKSEVARVLTTQPGFESERWVTLNEEGQATNTAPQRRAGRPYDQVFYRPQYSTERELPRSLRLRNIKNPQQNFIVISLVEKMAKRWQKLHPGVEYPGGKESADGRWINYDHNEFRTNYSDHNPVKFLLTLPGSDDD